MADSATLRRSSRLAQKVRRQPGVAEIAETTPSSSKISIPYLPLEVKGIIAEFLCKSDLKTLRCVSKQWHVMATPLLFDRVYVSPRNKDIQIFSHITKHPVLSRSIKAMICDVSTVPNMSHEEHFQDLCTQWWLMTQHIGNKDAFNSDYPRLNKLVNAIIRQRRPWEDSLSKYAHDEHVMEGWQLWQDLAKEEREALEHGRNGMYFSDLCSGLHRLSNLQSVMIDNDMWSKVGTKNHDIFDPSYFQHIARPTLLGSPLARSWVPWHLRLKQSNDAGFQHLWLVIQALSRTKRRVKHFSHQSWGIGGFSPSDFAAYKITDKFARHMIIALGQLQTLELQITPCRHDAIDHGNIDALGYLPQLLEQLANLKYLKLILASAERMTRGRLSTPTPLSESCYSYSQVFPQQGKWERLEWLHLSGLAIDGLDMVFLLLHQMPQLKRLWLRHIDLLKGNWSGVVEALRIRAVLRPWELLSLQGSLRYEDFISWPCKSSPEDVVLGKLMRYAKEGGRHPCLPPDVDDRVSACYFEELFSVAGLERVQAFRRRVQRIEDR